ncbi:WD repeat-containing protein 82 [Clydaea vesicula]|uniref:WD repeat-containing protein 82 n=1 Tax=Clydaea vesicula TaxID=447962 RepID=A0AAD5U7K3_9FUNG|nr:WD repeat-containing protein 82 [Clydaea vesicula]
MSLLLSHELGEFQIGKIFNDNKKTITSLDFDDTGEFCLTTSKDESLRIYNCLDGNKKYGCNLARFTHKSTNVIHSSTKEDDQIRYLSFHDNKYIRYFKGHTKRVVNLQVSPVEDLFLSSSLDGTIRLWDLRQSSSVGLLTIPTNFSKNQTKSCVAFDPSGLVFAVGHDSRCVRLYDCRNFDAGPFLTDDISQQSNYTLSSTEIFEWHSLEFSKDSEKLLISTNGNNSIVLNGENLDFEYIVNGYNNNAGMELEASFTPDCKYILCGSQDGLINFWDINDGRHICALPGTFTEEDSDEFAFTKIGSKVLLETIQTERSKYNCFTDHVANFLQHLHREGVTKEIMSEKFKELKVHYALPKLLELAKTDNADIIILSDSNTFYIETILKSNSLESYIKCIVTNPGAFDENGCLIVNRRTTIDNPHNCKNCQLNICKGTELLTIIKDCSYEKVFYFGDGKNDYCPSTKLSAADVTFVREGYALEKMLESEELSKLVKAEVVKWKDMNDLVFYFERLNGINKERL